MDRLEKANVAEPFRADEACLYTVLHAPQASHETLIRRFITPVADAIREDDSLDSFFFIRYNDPDWQLRFRVLGRRAWIDGPVRSLIEKSLEPVLAEHLAESVEYGEYLREWERYGGAEGMALAEKLFLHDSAACLDLIRVEAAGQMGKSRREYSLVHTERLLDLLGFERSRRRAFYEMGYRWAIDEGHWTDEDRTRLDAQYAKIRDGLRDLFLGAQIRDRAIQYGGAEPARISATCLEASRPVVTRLLAAHAGGGIAQDLVNLAWSYAHLHCNRLGIETSAEAILRYFMARFHEEADI